MPPKKEQKSKEAKALAAMSASRSKSKKKKWSKGKMKEKKDNAPCFFEQALFEKFTKEVVKMKVATVANVSEKFQISGSLARRCLKLMGTEGKMTCVISNGQQRIYTKI